MPIVKPIALTIAGSDSGGGAGIQADLKTFTALDVYGVSVITAITAQNTVAVTDIMALPIALVRAQLDAVMTDIGAKAAKTGMLASAELVEAVALGVRQYDITKLVVDPVMVAKGASHCGSGCMIQRATIMCAVTMYPQTNCFRESSRINRN